MRQNIKKRLTFIIRQLKKNVGYIVSIFSCLIFNAIVENPVETLSYVEKCKILFRKIALTNDAKTT